MSRVFRTDVDDPQHPQYEGAFVWDLGSGTQVFEDDQMRSNLTQWRETREPSEEKSLVKYITELARGNYSNKPEKESTNVLNDIMSEYNKFITESERTLNKIVRESDGKLHIPSVDRMLEIALEAQEDASIGEMKSPPLTLNPRLSDLIGKAPSPSDVGLTRAQGELMEQMAMQKSETINLTDREPPRPEDFGITPDMVPPTLENFEKINLDDEADRAPRLSDFGLDPKTMPIPQMLLQSKSNPSIESRPASSFAQNFDSPAISGKPFRALDEPATPITPHMLRSSTSTPHLGTIPHYPTLSDSLSHTPINTFRLNPVKDDESSPFDSPDISLQILRVPKSLKSPIQILQTDFNIRPVTEDEFEELPSYLRIGVQTKNLNEALLNFGKKSGGDRAFIFHPDELSPLESRVRPLLKRLSRIVLANKNGEFSLT